MEAVVYDVFPKALWPIFRTKPAFGIRLGITPPVQSLQKYGVDSLHIMAERERPAGFYEDYLKSQGMTLRKIKIEIGVEEFPFPLAPWTLFQEAIENDLKLADQKWHKPEEMKLQNVATIGSDIYLHPDARLGPFVTLDSQSGPIVIDENAQISSFSTLKGPAYIGRGSILDRVSLSNTVVGEQCRLGGEISDTLIGDFTNKHHEGFLGHSIVGDWVNLGALTTTSDLKNNYGKVRLKFQEETIETNEIKFGSVLGDFVKTSIGTMLNTGTVVDYGSLLYAERPHLKYYPPFFWGGADPEIYDLSRFLKDIRVIMARRNQKPSPFLIQQIQKIYASRFTA